MLAHIKKLVISTDIQNSSDIRAQCTVELIDGDIHVLAGTVDHAGGREHSGAIEQGLCYRNSGRVSHLCQSCGRYDNPGWLVASIYAVVPPVV